ncbi:hypothetical protein GMES_1798 [Paraglaciecola mesophila KMM 241]|uniref:Uncharacterized protein n=2 Tax=Paraglaciecola TaxID=1621534 RepID=K6XTZ2_9ALTE|nr:hypothetical protein GAGA_0193 [Paraglaciecola agarilytica NO2]GAC24094.1 hypothetical protein GMES_1798 [Paraglaciecola mesophila KMM 241]
MALSDEAKYESQGKLLGQRADGKSIQKLEVRVDTSNRI